MALLQKLNAMRRRLMYHLTRNVGKQNENKVLFQDKSEIKTILVTRPNHRLGNLLLITPLLQELENNFPDSKIDVFLKGNLGPIVLKEYKNVRNIISLPKNHFKKLPAYLYTWIKLSTQKYDLVINAVPESSSGKLSTKLCRGKYKIFGDENDKKTEPQQHIAKLPVFNFRNFIRGNQIGLDFAVPTLNLKLTSAEVDNGKAILREIVKNDKKTIAIFTYATGTKCYKKNWWMEFYTALQNRFPGYNIIEILPKENVSQIDFAAATFYSRDLREIAGLLANTAVFIGADSGMMHLAVAAQIPVAGLFSVTDCNKYKPYGGRNIAINTNKTSILTGIKQIAHILEEDDKKNNLIHYFPIFNSNLKPA